MENKRVIYIGAENIISPLGTSANACYQAVENGITGVAMQQPNDSFPTAKINNYTLHPEHSFLESIGIHCALSSLNQIQNSALKEKWVVIVCTTKGDITHLENGDIEKAKPRYLAKRILQQLPIEAHVEVVSNACISGVSGAILAHDLLVAKKYNHALILGLDEVSTFTQSGFESFFALSKSGCKPFDQHRDGLNLGEASASLVLSSQPHIFTTHPLQFLGGATANDANHISGPSRTGEGLVRAIKKALFHAQISPSEIDFINAHGTATPFNDNMESIAFQRLQLNAVPTNSLKGYFGHTLGAAGVVELAMTMQSMKNQKAIATFGCDHPGTTQTLNVCQTTAPLKIQVALKTASGFGGCNAAALLKMNSL